MTDFLINRHYQPLAAGQHAVEHRLMDTFRITGLLRQISADRCIDELPAFRKVLSGRQNLIKNQLINNNSSTHRPDGITLNPPVNFI